MYNTFAHLIKGDITVARSVDVEMKNLTEAFKVAKLNLKQAESALKVYKKAKDKAKPKAKKKAVKPVAKTGKKPGKAVKLKAVKKTVTAKKAGRPKKAAK